jgi:hypothetical protein
MFVFICSFVCASVRAYVHACVRVCVIAYMCMCECVCLHANLCFVDVYFVCVAQLGPECHSGPNQRSNNSGAKALVLSSTQSD